MQGRRDDAAKKEEEENLAASAKAAMDKTKVAIQAMGEKLLAHTQEEKDRAEEKKEEKMVTAEVDEQKAREKHQADRVHSAGGYHL